MYRELNKKGFKISFKLIKFIVLMDYIVTYHEDFFDPNESFFFNPKKVEKIKNYFDDAYKM
jgi:hypothetical protein